LCALFIILKKPRLQKLLIIGPIFLVLPTDPKPAQISISVH
jgi:hypothetical protein